MNKNQQQIDEANFIIEDAVGEMYKGFFRLRELNEYQEEYDSMLFLNVVMDYQEFADNYKYFLQRFKYSKLSSSTASRGPTSSRRSTVCGRCCRYWRRRFPEA